MERPEPLKLEHPSRKYSVFGALGNPYFMEAVGFELVCATCLTTRGVLESERLPETCPECGATDPWKGPFAAARASGEQIAESPFYLAASGGMSSSGVASS
jgi:hypothetical protein